MLSPRKPPTGNQPHALAKPQLDREHGITTRPELMRLGIYLVLIGVGLVATIIGLFWLKDRLQSPRLARVAHSEPIMRLTVIGGALTVIGLLLILSSQFQSASG